MKSRASVSFRPDDELSRSLNESQFHARRRAPRPRFWSQGEEEGFTRNNGQRRGVSTGEHVTSTTTSVSRTLPSQVSGKRQALMQQLKQQVNRSSGMALLRHASKRLCKSARMYSHHKKHPRDIEVAFFLSNPALTIYAFITMAMISKQAIFLYGVLLVLWAQITWIALKWFLYVIDDPELHTMHSFFKGWINVLMREGSRITSGKSPRALWFAGTIAREIPLGVGLARVYIRNFTERVNRQTLNELHHHMVRYSRD